MIAIKLLMTNTYSSLKDTFSFVGAKLGRGCLFFFFFKMKMEFIAIIHSSAYPPLKMSPDGYKKWNSLHLSKDYNRINQHDFLLTNKFSSRPI